MSASRIEFHSGPDRYNRCQFTLFWWTDYTPGHLEGEYVRRERAQCFFADPRDYGFSLPITVRDLV